MRLPTRWVRSSRCSDGYCIEVRWAGDCVEVRDSKHPDRPALEYDRDSWADVLDDVLRCVMPDDVTWVCDGVVWRREGRELQFTSAEWHAFEDGVWDGEFDLEALVVAGPLDHVLDLEAGLREATRG